MTTRPSRRERLRNATVREIKETARQLLTSGGPTAIAFRAIAREMGMTAAAIYRYFPSQDALIGQLCTDLHAELATSVEAAGARAPTDPPDERLRVMARALRRWSVAHRTESSLIFCGSIATASGARGEVVASTASVAEPFLVEFRALWRQRGFAALSPTPIADGFADHLSPQLLARRSGLPVDAVYLFLSGWTRLYGVVAMEVLGHLSWALTDAEYLFEAEIAGFLHQLTPSRSS